LKGYVGNTDWGWFHFLRERSRQPRGVEEVNFWRPTGQRFAALQPGAPFFFRLKAPRNKVAGFGTFARFSVLPDWLAWEAFGEGNGAATRDAFVGLLDRYRGAKHEGPRLIGCIILTQPVFFDEALWVDDLPDWAKNIVAGKGYDLSVSPGLELWRDCREFAAGGGKLALGEKPVEARYGAPSLVKPRLGQGAFRVAVLDAYGRACAVTTEHSLPVLQAAHIQPYSQGGPHDPANGLLLRSDVHSLFDHGYLTVTDDHRLELSPRLRGDWGNGKAYEAFHGQRIHLPDTPGERPAAEFLRWHQEHVFLGAA
jgi:putative restriction endonuclease